MRDILNDLGFDFSDLIALIALVVSLITFVVNFKRNKKLSTIKEFNEIRHKYPYIKKCSKNKDSYLKELERFSVAVNNNVYDANIVNKMSGKLLINQYDSFMKDYIETKPKEYYTEYVKFIHTLKRKRIVKQFIGAYILGKRGI